MTTQGAGQWRIRPNGTRPTLTGIWLTEQHPAALSHLCTSPTVQKAALKPAYSAKRKITPLEGSVDGVESSSSSYVTHRWRPEHEPGYILYPQPCDSLCPVLVYARWQAGTVQPLDQRNTKDDLKPALHTPHCLTRNIWCSCNLHGCPVAFYEASDVLGKFLKGNYSNKNSSKCCPTTCSNHVGAILCLQVIMPTNNWRQFMVLRHLASQQCTNEAAKRCQFYKLGL